MHPLAPRFDALFDGLRRAYGYYILDAHQSGVKQKGRGGYKYEAVNPELWSKHLNGEGGIGVVPIRDDATCSWGAIDIDAYVGMDHQKLVDKIETAKMPLVVCRSKSGGAHVFIFTKDPVPAYLIRDKLKLMASWLGHADAEIFPKQTEINVERKDIGNYLNMPYDGPHSLRYGVRHGDTEPMEAEEFLTFAEKRKLTTDQLEKLQIKAVAKKVQIEMFEDGPPCLETMHANGGFPEGTRNMGLFNAGIYFVKKFSDNWQAKLIEYNDKFVDPSLPYEELQKSVLRSLTKKGPKDDGSGYFYTCKQSPCREHCNAQLCKSRPFGITVEETDHASITSLQRLNTEPPVFIATLEDGRTVDLDEMDLQNQRTFQRKCISQLNFMPKLMGTKAWETTVQKLLETITVIDVPGDSTPAGILMFHLEQFLVYYGQAREWAQILEGLPFHDGEAHWFRMPDFMKYLQRQKFNDLNKSEIANVLRKRGVNHKQKIITKDKKRFNTGLYYCSTLDSYTDPTELVADEAEVM